MKLLLKNADLYTPNHIGCMDILIKDRKIAQIAEHIDEDCEQIECDGKIVCPMFVDGHEHLEFTRFYSENGILSAGVGTTVGVLANESGEEETQNLILIAKELNKNKDLTVYCLAGSKNCVYDTSKYIAENQFCVGIKTALYCEQRPKPNLSYEKLKSDAVSTYNAGLSAGKTTQVHIHLDHPYPRGEKPDVDKINSGEVGNLDWIDKIVQETGVPYSLFKLTHCQKYYDKIIEYANKGCWIDYTAFSDKYDYRYDSLLKAIKQNTVDLTKISISSDLGIMNLECGHDGEETPITILNTIQKLVLEKGVELETALKMITTNALAPIYVCENLINIGDNAKILILNKDLTINTVINNSFDCRHMEKNYE